MKIQVEQRNKNAIPEERHGKGGKKKLRYLCAVATDTV